MRLRPRRVRVGRLLFGRRRVFRRLRSCGSRRRDLGHLPRGRFGHPRRVHRAVRRARRQQEGRYHLFRRRHQFHLGHDDHRRRRSCLYRLHLPRFSERHRQGCQDRRRGPLRRGRQGRFLQSRASLQRRHQGRHVRGRSGLPELHHERRGPGSRRCRLRFRRRQCRVLHGFRQVRQGGRGRLLFRHPDHGEARRGL